jgi:hypothetical protein
MANFIKQLLDGVESWVAGITTSAGSGDSGKVAVLDSNGKFDMSFMPAGLGTDTQSIVASEALAAGDFVNIYNASGTKKVRKANATSGVAHPAHGCVKSAYSSADTALVYTGTVPNDQLTGLTYGSPYYLGKTAGAATSDISAFTTGDLVQFLGYATDATTIEQDLGTSAVIA